MAILLIKDFVYKTKHDILYGYVEDCSDEDIVYFVKSKEFDVRGNDIYIKGGIEIKFDCETPNGSLFEIGEQAFELNYVDENMIERVQRCPKSLIKISLDHGKEIMLNITNPYHVTVFDTGCEGIKLESEGCDYINGHSVQCFKEVK